MRVRLRFIEKDSENENESGKVEVDSEKEIWLRVPPRVR